MELYTVGFLVVKDKVPWETDWFGYLVAGSLLSSKGKWDWTEGGIKLWCSCNNSFSQLRGSSEARISLQRCLKWRQGDWNFAPLQWSVIGCGLSLGQAAPFSQGQFLERVTVEKINGLVLGEIWRAHYRIQYSPLPLPLKSVCFI